MPIYEFKCDKCGSAGDVLCKIEDRKRPRPHSAEGSKCHGMLIPLGLAAPTIGKPGYQMGAVLADGSVVNGHFGKEARRGKKGWSRP